MNNYIGIGLIIAFVVYILFEVRYAIPSRTMHIKLLQKYLNEMEKKCA